MSMQLALFATEVSTSPFIRLDRPTDREHPCCGNDLAVIGSSTTVHAASLTCATCGKHRGWLPAAALDFIKETLRVFGSNAEIPTIRPISISEAAMAKHASENHDSYTKQNRGALFKNPKKSKDEGDRRPHYTGPLDVGGKKFNVAAWLDKTRTGETYMSLAVKPKDKDNTDTNGAVGAPF